jgi:photosystem II stability/assembly factor-like uncharacterized protein
MFRSPARSLPFLLLLILCTGARTATAGANRWTPLGPDGGTVFSLAADPEAPGTLYAGTDGGGVWKSTDGGVHWRSASRGLASPDVYALAVSPGNPGTVWATTGGGIYKSTDDGALWRRIWYEAERPDDTYTSGTTSIAIDPTNPDVAWAGTVWGWILKTTDGGASWERPLDSPAQFRAILIDPTDPETVYAGVSKTTDGGATWQEIPGIHGGLLALDPSNPRILYSGGGFDNLWKSLDSGATWIRLPGFTYSVEAFLVDPSDPDVLVAGESGVGLSRSEDGGQTWNLVKGLPFFQVPALAADLAQPGRIWLGASERGVFRSLDSGRTWIASRQGLRASKARSVAFDPVQPRTLYAAALTTGVHRSTDAGRTWTRINRKLPAGAGYGVVVNTVAAHPLRPGTLFAGTGGGVYRSLDRGDHWSFVSPTPEDFNAFAFDPQQPDTVFAAGNILLRSRNGGRTWKRLVLPRTEYEPEIAKVIVAPLRPTTVFVLDFNQRHGDAQSLFRSPDGGNTWKLVFEGGPAALALHPTDPDIAYLATEAGKEIWRSSDGGLTWEMVATGVGGAAALTSLLIDRLDPAILYLGTNGSGVWRSTDHGALWAPLTAGMIAPRITCLEADPRNPRRIVACTWGGGLLEIQISSGS